MTLAYFEMAGRFLAMSLKELHPLGVRLSSAILKSIMAREVTWHDLEHFDRPVYLSFKSFMDPGAVVDRTFPQYFVYGVTDADGTLRDEPLCAGGESMLLTDENKHLFVALYASRQLVGDGIQQMTYLVKGFRALCDKKLLQKLQVAELGALFEGPQHALVSIKSLRQHVRYGGHYNPETPAVTWFWQAMMEMDETDQKRLIAFGQGHQLCPCLDLINGMQKTDGHWRLRVTRMSRVRPRQRH
jgi:hypothetical protein